MRYITAALVVYALPVMARAKPVGTFEYLVSELGDQVDPAIDGQFVVYAGPGATGDLDVFLRDIGSGSTQPIADGPGDQDSPDVFLSTAIYRTPQGVVIESWPSNRALRSPPDGGDGIVSNPVVHAAVAAWEQRGGATGTDIVVSRYRAGAEYVLRAPGGADPTGDQHSPAVFDDLVAYVDDARGGSVWLHDSARGPSNWTRICDGVASGVSIGTDGTRYVLAVARSSGPTGEDIEIYDRDGALLAALPGPGPQRNPHLSGEWVAFDDTSSASSQVAVWRWKTPPGEANLVFVPHPSRTDQKLNDLSLVLSQEVRVVFEDTGSEATGRDIALYRLPIDPIVFDGEPNGWPIAAPSPPKPADCSSPDATVLATLRLVRGAGKPSEDSVKFSVDPPDGSDELPVLVCLHAEDASSAWVFLGREAVARPDDFEPHVVDLSRPAEVEKGEARLSGRLEGKPGSLLAVRVLADPARAGACREDEDDDRGRDDAHRRPDRGRHRCSGGGAGAGPGAAPSAAVPIAARSGGCGNPGAFASLASLAALLARRRLRV